MADPQNTNDKLLVVQAALQSAGLGISERKQGIRVKTDTGYAVDIFALKSSPDHIRARIKLDEADPLRRQAFVESIQNTLAGALNGTAKVQDFCLSREADGIFFYNAVLEPSAPLMGETTVEISPDAVEVVEAAGTSDLSGTEEELDFQLDFDLKEDSRLKIGKSLAEEAIERLETVDAKMLRQSLDMMSLKRSSVVRLAVTRICRDAMDVESLETALQEEARRIVTPEDRMELQHLKTLTTNGFLDPIVDLLWQEVFNEAY